VHVYKCVIPTDFSSTALILYQCYIRDCSDSQSCQKPGIQLYKLFPPPSPFWPALSICTVQGAYIESGQLSCP